MIKPFYQGKLDSFCAIYAVLNVLRLIHGIRTLKAREILNETLLGLAANPDALRAVLEQDTDYVGLVDGMLRIQHRRHPLKVAQPWVEADHADEEEFWRNCRIWLKEGTAGKRAVIVRFMRYLKPDGPPVNRHWTVIDRINDSSLHLFDCSHEAEAVLHIRKQDFVTDESRVSQERLIVIQPHTARFIRSSF